MGLQITYAFPLKEQKIKEAYSLNQSVAQIHMLFSSSMLNYKLSICAKLWGNVRVRERHASEL